MTAVAERLTTPQVDDSPLQHDVALQALLRDSGVGTELYDLIPDERTRSPAAAYLSTAVMMASAGLEVRLIGNSQALQAAQPQQRSWLSLLSRQAMGQWLDRTPSLDDVSNRSGTPRPWLTALHYSDHSSALVFRAATAELDLYRSDGRFEFLPTRWVALTLGTDPCHRAHTIALSVRTS